MQSRGHSGGHQPVSEWCGGQFKRGTVCVWSVGQDLADRVIGAEGHNPGISWVGVS